MAIKTVSEFNEVGQSGKNLRCSDLDIGGKNWTDIREVSEDGKPSYKGFTFPSEADDDVFHALTEAYNIIKKGNVEDGHVIVEFPLSKDIGRITFSSWKGNEFLDLRRFYEKDGDYRPTKKGMHLDYEDIGTVLSLMEQKRA